MIDQNTVSAKNQVKQSKRAYYLGNPTASKKILIVGNSITWHEPCAEVGWYGNCGMSASATEKDYVHLLFEMLKKDKQDVFIRVSQCAEWERTFFKDEDILSKYDEDREFDADLVIFRLGENVAVADMPYFDKPFRQFVRHICPRGKMLFTTCFWENPALDPLIKAFAKERGEACVDCCFSKDEKNMALGLFEHRGVALHPGDLGMERIAKAIFAQLQENKAPGMR